MFAELPENQKVIGVQIYRRAKFENIFFNKLISDVFTEDRMELKELSDEELRREKMENAAIVDIEITSPDAIVIKKTTHGGLHQFVNSIGGLFSLHAGLSFMSLSEVLFWIFKLIWIL